mmetsp:Transcript_5851/g.11225  ORF Transcript_5851/g.11225 Transcript_5851/m.11225 type:complete len:720 (-) Transcript_5851:317-2476(-)
MAAAKTMFMHLLDGGITMNDCISTAKDSDSKWSMVKSVISSFTLQRMLASKTVECGVICATGNDEMKECVELRRPSSAALKLIQDIDQEGDESSNLLGGISEAHEVLMETNRGKKFNRVLIVYTDGQSPLFTNQKEIESLKRDFLDQGVIFYCLIMCDQIRDDLSPSVSDNISQFREFTEQVGGNMAVVHDLQGGMKFLSSGPGLGTRPMQSKILFEISPTLKLSCVYCTKTTKAPLPSLKKQSNLSYDEDVPESGKVSTNYIYRDPNDPDEELEFEERVKGYRYGPQYIPMAGLDENILKLVSEPVLRLLGCVPVSSIERRHFLTSSFVVGVAAGDCNDGARNAIGALSSALQRLKQAALCRLVKRANADPWLVVLLPNPDGTLLMHRLPCSEDIRNFLFPPLTSMASVAPLQKQAVAAAVDSMTISTLQPDALLMVNPASMAFLSQLQENAKTIDGPLAGIQSYDDTFKSLGDHANSVKTWAVVKDLFNLEPTDQSSRDKKKRKQYWSDFNVVSGTEISVDNKADIKIEGASQSHKIAKKDEFSVPLELSEGSVNPVEDLDKIISSYVAAKNAAAGNVNEIQDVVLKSLRVMERFIELNVMTGSTSAHYRKSCNCLMKLREVSLIDFGDVVPSVVERFNDYLRVNIKAAFKGGRHNSFWKLVVDGCISLIHTGESTIGGVSAEDSKKFLEESVQAVEVVTEVKVEEEEDDDLFGDMA